MLCVIAKNKVILFRLFYSFLSTEKRFIKFFNILLRASKFFLPYMTQLISFSRGSVDRYSNAELTGI